MVVKYQGRLRYKQYNPSKPEKYHIKTFGVCDSTTGYAYNLITYYGSETSYNQNLPLDFGQSEKIFEYLLSPLGDVHHIFADRYYTTHKLIKYLSSRRFHYTGTFMRNRVGFPDELKANLNYLETKYARSSSGMLACAWKDKKAKQPVLIVSTKYAKGDVEVTTKRHGLLKVKPCIVHEYNLSMNGCDHLDQLISYYNNFSRKTCKWWKRVFMWIIEVSQIKSFNLYTLTRTHGSAPKELKSYKEELICLLLDKAAMIYSPGDVIPSSAGRRPTTVPVVERVADKKHQIVYDSSDRNCVVCSTSKSRKCTNFKCSGCGSQPYLHPKDCFLAFHSKQ